MKKYFPAILAALFALSGIAFAEDHEGETAEEHAAHSSVKPGQIKKKAKAKKKTVVKRVQKNAPPKVEELPTVDTHLEDSAPAPADVKE